jgi:hypothetical protein
MTIDRYEEGREPLLAILVALIPKLIVIVVGLAATTIPTPARADLDSLKRSCATKYHHIPRTSTTIQIL